MDAEAYLVQHLNERKEARRASAGSAAPAKHEPQPKPTPEELADTWETVTAVSALLPEIVMLRTDLRLVRRQGLFGLDLHPVASGRIVLSDYTPGTSGQFNSDGSALPGVTYARHVQYNPGTPPRAKGVFMNYNGWLSQYDFSPAGKEINDEGLTTIIIPKKPITEVHSFYEEHGKPPVYEPRLVLDGLAVIAEARLDVTPSGLLAPRAQPAQ